MCRKDIDGIANSVDPDRTAPLGAVRSGSTLFAQTFLSENLGTIQYYHHNTNICNILAGCAHVPLFVFILQAYNDEFLVLEVL